MLYELFLRASTPLTAIDLSHVRELIDGLDLPGGELRIEPYHHGEELTGVDLGVRPGGLCGSEALCRAAFAVAERLSLAVYDPQLGRSVSEVDQDQIRARFDQVAAFESAAPLGTPKDIGPVVGPRAWPWLLGAVALLVLLARLPGCLG